MNKYKSGRGRNRSEKPLVSLSPFTARLLSKAVPEHDWLNAQPILYPHQMDTEEDGIPEGPWLGFDSGEDKSRTGFYRLEFDEYDETDYSRIEQRILDHYEANPLRNPALANAARHVERSLASVASGLVEQLRELARNMPPIAFRSTIHHRTPEDTFVQQASAANLSASDVERMMRYATAYGASTPQLQAIAARRGNAQYTMDIESPFSMHDAQLIHSQAQSVRDTLQRAFQRAADAQASPKCWVLLAHYAKTPQDRELLITAAKDLGCAVDGEYAIASSAEQRAQVLEAYELRRKNLGAGSPEAPRKVRRSVGGLPVIDEIDGAGRIVRKAGKCN